MINKVPIRNNLAKKVVNVKSYQYVMGESCEESVQHLLFECIMEDLDSMRPMSGHIFNSS